MRCTCPRLKLGSEVLEERNWDPDCKEHGTESKWWNSPEEVARREVQRQRTEELWKKRRSRGDR